MSEVSEVFALDNYLSAISLNSHRKEITSNNLTPSRFDNKAFYSGKNNTFVFHATYRGYTIPSLAPHLIDEFFKKVYVGKTYWKLFTSMCNNESKLCPCTNVLCTYVHIHTYDEAELCFKRIGNKVNNNDTPDDVDLDFLNQVYLDVVMNRINQLCN